MIPVKSKTAGFTLVELIVVIAILGILAGIAVPVYSGYIAKANDAADLMQLDAVKTAIFTKFMEDPAAVVGEGEDDPYSFSIDRIEIDADGLVTLDTISEGENFATIVLGDDSEGIDISQYYDPEISPLHHDWTWTPEDGWKVKRDP